MNKIPCFVISYNRPTFLRKCVEALAHEERLEIIIIANDGGQEERHMWIGDEANELPMSINCGHKVVWDGKFYPLDRPYIVTDCDIVVPWKLPWLDILLSGMERLPNYNKFGLGLNTRHIPDSYPQKAEVLHHENHVIYKKPIGDARFIEAPVDTTLALYRAGYTKYSVWGNDSELQYTGECKAVRTYSPYEATHLTWQMTKEELAGEEHQHYCKSINKNSTHWSEK